MPSGVELFNNEQIGRAQELLVCSCQKQLRGNDGDSDDDDDDDDV